jgi:uncharacterized protein YceK
LLLFVSGCGTANNIYGTYANDFSGGPAAVYGGARADLYVLTHPAGLYKALAAEPPNASDSTGEVTTRAAQQPSAMARATAIAYLVSAATADLPLSVVADTLTLPYTVARSVHASQHPPEPAPTDSAKGAQPQASDIPGP